MTTTAEATLRVMVLADPWGKFSTFLPDFRETYDELVQRGLFLAGKVGDTAFTEAGLVAHILAREANPARAFYRQPEQIQKRHGEWRYARHYLSRSIDTARAMQFLEKAGIAEPDLTYNRGKAWRLCY